MRPSNTSGLLSRGKNIGGNTDGPSILLPRKLLRRNTWLLCQEAQVRILLGAFANPFRGGVWRFIMIEVLLWFFVLAVFVFVVAFMFSA